MVRLLYENLITRQLFNLNKTRGYTRFMDSDFHNNLPGISAKEKKNFNYSPNVSLWNSPPKDKIPLIQMYELCGSHSSTSAVQQV